MIHNYSTRYDWIAEYLYIPYQVLQILGYRLVGKHCTYKWRKARPEPVGPTTKWQHLVAGVFPTAVLLALFLCQLALSVYIYALYFEQYPWVILIYFAQPLFPFCLYGAWMIFDYLRLRRLLTVIKDA